MTQITLNNRSYGRMAELATLAHNAGYKEFANVHEAEFFKAMLEMDDSQVRALIDLYTATADINHVVEVAL